MYLLKINNRDDYVFFHNEFSCMEVEKTRTVKCETIYKEDGKILKVSKYDKVYIAIDGKEEPADGCQYNSFDTLDDLKNYFEQEYEYLYTDKYYSYFLDTEMKDTVVRIPVSKNKTFAHPYINLEKVIVNTQNIKTEK